MAEILMFHHAMGLTDGLVAFAERLRAAGHVVHSPDLYAGATFTDADEGVAYAQSIGHDALEEAAHLLARRHRGADVLMGFSLGAMPAQLLAQDRRRMRACMLVSGALPPSALGGVWRHEVALQIHVADPDEYVEPDEIDALLCHAPHARVYRYPSKGHLFMDPSLPEYDADAADRFEERATGWLADIDEHLLSRRPA
ncbi:dienelactone hydrolase family protein [Demequina lignilytica]|uniref:Dienelactone hydrolase family protein n=1 Tax=Demequina lignilytica TaxID=3051663 RepID=A0AB35MJ09_9MICO|nr:dienelactone hydrolase family protein [Demequina sp. SYSU T0a273]MDN4483791.1 dienelactone hydrolase family protein [Demequina sp. SYSU T0a273]